MGFHRTIRIAVMLTLILESVPTHLLFAAPPVITPSITKEPMIEVSVDSLEISENNTNILGFLWGQSFNLLNGPTAGQINFIERTIPSLFNVGQLDRGFIGAQLSALIKTNQVRVLANPTLLTKSEFEANFLVGGEIPYPQVGQGGVSGVGSSRVDLQACKLEYSIVSPK